MRRIQGHTFLSLLKKNPVLCACWAGRLPQTGQNHILLVERLRNSYGELLPHAVSPELTHGVRVMIKSSPSKICFYGQYDCIFDQCHPDFFAIQIAHKLSWAMLRCSDKKILLGESDRPWIECIELIFRSIRERESFTVIDFPRL